VEATEFMSRAYVALDEATILYGDSFQTSFDEVRISVTAQVGGLFQ
jgi:hypothetical protein